MSEDCPNCGAPFSKRIAVEMGDTYADVFGRTPRSFLAEYVRICPDPEEARQASRQANTDLTVYLHDLRDVAQSGRTAD